MHHDQASNDNERGDRNGKPVRKPKPVSGVNVTCDRGGLYEEDLSALEIVRPAHTLGYDVATMRELLTGASLRLLS